MNLRPMLVQTVPQVCGLISNDYVTPSAFSAWAIVSEKMDESGLDMRRQGPRACPSKIRFFPAAKTKSSSKPRLYLPFFPLFARRLHLFTFRASSILHRHHAPSFHLCLASILVRLVTFSQPTRALLNLTRDTPTTRRYGEELFIGTVCSRDISFNLFPHPSLTDSNTT